MRRLALVVLLCGVTAQAAAPVKRDPKVVRVWRKTHPCPATGKTTGACPGWRADHIIPLELYGPDRVDNLQWQELEASKVKDKLENEAAKVMRRETACTP